jgi:hypothetical protein
LEYDIKNINGVINVGSKKKSKFKNNKKIPISDRNPRSKEKYYILKVS